VATHGARAAAREDHRVFGRSRWSAAYVQKLRELGWVEGRAVAIVYRWAEGRSERYSEIAAEFVRLKVDVILTVGGAAVAAQQATSAIFA
jgi:putative tryptophan/tyrosine transport system substrate-binding protein